MTVDLLDTETLSIVGLQGSLACKASSEVVNAVVNAVSARGVMSPVKSTLYVDCIVTKEESHAVGDIDVLGVLASGCSLGGLLVAELSAVLGGWLGAALGMKGVCLFEGRVVGLIVGKLDGEKVGSLVGMSVETSVGERVGSTVGKMVGSSVGDSVGKSVGSSVGDTVG